MLHALSSGVGIFYWHKSAATPEPSPANLNAAESGTVVAKQDMNPPETIALEEAAGILGVSLDSGLLKVFRRVEGPGSVQVYRAEVLDVKFEMDAAADRRRRRVIELPILSVPAEAENDELIRP